MTSLSPRASGSALNHAQITHARIAELERSAETRIISLRSLTAGNILKRIYSGFASTVTGQNQKPTWLSSPVPLKDKSEWPDLKNLLLGQNNTRS